MIFVWTKQYVLPTRLWSLEDVVYDVESPGSGWMDYDMRQQKLPSDDSADHENSEIMTKYSNMFQSSATYLIKKAVTRSQRISLLDLLP